MIKSYFEALCFNEVAEFNDPVFALLVRASKIKLFKSGMLNTISGLEKT